MEPSYTALEGSDFIISCSATANQQASSDDVKIKWFLNDKEVLDTGGRISITMMSLGNGAWQSDLSFQPIRHFDSGTYMHFK